MMNFFLILMIVILLVWNIILKIKIRRISERLEYSEKILRDKWVDDGYEAY
jgi:predicted Holliday junction resolvase-like endonuclease